VQEYLLQLFHSNPQLAILISICISIVIAVIGVIPSVFITAANILFFGFWGGTLVSFAGEAIGAGIAFILYRKGFKQLTSQSLAKYTSVKKIVEAENKEAAILVFSLRLMPFVPSGIITFAAAIGKVSFIVFLLSSSIGKIPALLIEAWSVYEVKQFAWQGKTLLAIAAIGLIIWIFTKKKR
jgi:uncharacterized membrane protein YdjX (TVP38/TMEM64 family)